MQIKNINPLGAVQDLLLDREVEAGQVVDVTAEQVVDRVSTGNYEPADDEATKAIASAERAAAKAARDAEKAANAENNEEG